LARVIVCVGILLQSGQTRFRGQQQQQRQPPWYMYVLYGILLLQCTCIVLYYVYIIFYTERSARVHTYYYVYINTSWSKFIFFIPFRTSETIRLRTLVRRGTLLSGHRARAHASAYIITRAFAVNTQYVYTSAICVCVRSNQCTYNMIYGSLCTQLHRYTIIY